MSPLNLLFTVYAAFALHAHIVVPITVLGLVIVLSPRRLAALLRLIERIWLIWHRVERVCPNADCYKSFEAPIFQCPVCGAQYPDLRPSVGGLLVRRCKSGACDQRLPTWLLNGREQLPQLCPHCRGPLGVGLGPGIHVPLVAGVGAGKSSFLMAAMAELQGLALRKKVRLTFPDHRTKGLFQDLHQASRQGWVPAKTTDIAPDAFRVGIEDELGNQGVLHVYDAAGEVYQRTDQIRGQQYISHAGGFLFVIDPFSLPSAQCRFKEHLENNPRIVACAQEPQDVYDGLTEALREAAQMVDGAFKQPFAVLLTKIDVFDLEAELRRRRPDLRAKGDRLGARAAAEGAGGRHVKFRIMGGGLMAVRSQAVKVWLEEMGQGNLVRSIEGDFSSRLYSGCSPLGRMPEAASEPGRPFTPRGVLPILAWILAHHGLELDGSVVKLARRVSMKHRRVRLLITVASIGGGLALMATASWLASPILLRTAAERGEAGIVRSLLETGPGIDSMDAGGETALLKAARSGHDRIVRLLLRARPAAKVDLASRAGETALMVASGGGHSAVVEELLIAGANPNRADAAAESALVLAIRGQSYDIAEFLLLAGADPDGLNRSKAPVLAEAIGSGDVEIVRLLLKYGADPRIPQCRDEGGNGCLRQAVERGTPEVAEALLQGEEGNRVSADEISGRGDRARGALDVAAERQDRVMLRLVLDHGGKFQRSSPQTRQQALELAHGEGDRELFRRLLSAGADPDGTDGAGRTWLVRAVLAAERGFAADALDGGADRDRQDPVTEKTPVLLAIEGGQPDLVELLLNRGASLKIAGPDGDLPLHRAIAIDQAEMARAILARGGREAVNARGARGHTPMEVACVKGDCAMAALLLECGARRPARNADFVCLECAP